MPKVIGDDPTAIKRITHKDCGKIIEYVPNDVVNLWKGTDYGGGPAGADGFKCPHCGNDVVIRSW